MLALTVHQPWAHLIAHDTKRIENREWEPPRELVGRHFAIHAAVEPRTKKACAELADLAAENLVPLEDLAYGAVVAVVRLAGVLRSEPPLSSPHSVWWTGPVGWALDDVVALERPIPCKGQRKLWSMPEEIVAPLRLQWKAGKGMRLTYPEAERLALQDPRTH